MDAMSAILHLTTTLLLKAQYSLLFMLKVSLNLNQSVSVALWRLKKTNHCNQRHL